MKSIMLRPPVESTTVFFKAELPVGKEMLVAAESTFGAWRATCAARGSTSAGVIEFTANSIRAPYGRCRKARRAGEIGGPAFMLNSLCFNL
jgi:hypothetical protein